MKSFFFFFRSEVSFSRDAISRTGNMGAMQAQLQIDGTLPVALRGVAELTACAD